MKIFWTKESKENLLSIGRFISIDNSQAAARTISNIRKRVLPLKDKAFLGRIVPETGDKSIREIIYKNYRIVYQIKLDRINILTVLEGINFLNCNNCPDLKRILP